MSFKIGKTEFKISFLFCILLALLITFDSDNILFFTFIFALFHELSHILMMIILRQRVKEISFEPFGIFIKKEENESSFKADILIFSAGCIFNLFAFALFFLAYHFTGLKIFLKLFAINFILFAFNALPAKNLDGGDCLKLISEKYLSPENADKSGKIISAATAATLFATGMILCLKVGFNPSLLITALYLMFKTFNSDN